jgi:nuclear pore complex protein Nup155
MAFPQVTPMRPVPGAFINTPAMPRGSVSSAADPVRRRLFPEPDPTGARGQGNTPISFSANPTTAAPVPAGGVGGVVSGSRSQLPPTDPSSPIVKAARAINSVLQTDESYPDLDSYCRRKNARLSFASQRPGM